MSNRSSAIIFFTILLLASSCAKESNPNRSSKNNQDSEKKDPQAEEDNQNGALCYQPSQENTCYTLQDIKDVHQAEPLYDYVSPDDTGFPSSLNPTQYRDPKKLYFVPEVAGSTRLAENFQRQEFIWANSTRGHYGHFSPTVVRKVQQLRDHFGKPLKVTSGYRSPGYNSTLPGAARFSRHTFGDAIDFRIAGVGFQQIAQICKNLGAAFTQIYKSHIHCDWRTTPLDERVFGSAGGAISRLSHAEILSEIEDASLIEYEKLDDDGRFKFSVKTDNEDGEGLLHEWQFYSNDSLIASSEAETPTLELTSGQYQVYVKVGGNIEILDRIEVN